MSDSPRFLQLAAQARERITEIPPEGVNEALSAGAAIIDVRETSEFSVDHIPGAQSLPKGIVESVIEETFPDLAAPILCYCNGGNRAALVAENLQRMGYTNVRSLAGGLNAWINAGVPIEKTPTTPTP